MHTIIFFPEEKIILKNRFLADLKFSDPLPETHFLFGHIKYLHMSADESLNLSSELGLPSILISICTEVNKVNNTGKEHVSDDIIF